MLKKRIIAIVTVKDNVVVQSFGFAKYLPIGSVDVTLEFLSTWGIDEIFLLDISATVNKSNVVLNSLHKAVKKCFVPLTYGGYLNNSTKVSLAFNSGADKVLFNNAFFNNHSIIEDTALKYGSQSCVISIDVIQQRNNYRVFDYSKKSVSSLTVHDSVKLAQDLGVGEIFINSVDRDGSYLGFDKKLADKIYDSRIPVIFAGGARCASHFDDMFYNKNIDALAAGNMFHFVEHSVIKLKSTISSVGIREDDQLNYSNHSFNDDQRLMKLNDKKLSSMMYHKFKDREK
jgi:imidazole glycerol-phosphate synthase subunit HisF